MTMSKIKKINIDNRDINDLIKSLTKLSNDINELPKEISKEIAEIGLVKLNDFYGSKVDDPNITDIQTSIRETATGYQIISKGRDVIYEEFGTGDKGQQTPHKEKSKYGLKPYNDGVYIRDVNPNNEKLISQGITSGKYWTYKKDGKVYYTQGVPAGMEMFKTSNYLRDKGIKQILDKKVGEVLSKV